MNSVIKQALYKAQYRGTRELDFVFRQFTVHESEKAIKCWNKVDWNLFLNLLEETEENLTQWLIYDQRLPSKYARFAFVLIKSLWNVTFSIQDLNQLDSLAEALSLWIKMNRDLGLTFGFVGDLGAGKTTLCKKIISTLLLMDESEIKSPTFNIVQEYMSEDLKFIHADLYRLNDVDEVFELGLLEHILSRQYCVLIEWPQILEPYISENYIKINIALKKEGDKNFYREISFSAPKRA